MPVVTSVGVSPFSVLLSYSILLILLSVCKVAYLNTIKPKNTKETPQTHVARFTCYVPPGKRQLKNQVSDCSILLSLKICFQ